MPRIRQIVNEPGLSGRLPAQSVSSAAFGGATSESMMGLGNAAVRVADFMQDNEDRADVSNVHAQMAKARADWTLNLAERARTAPAGDDTFAQKFSEDFDNYALDAQNIAKTRAGQEAFKTQAAALRGSLLERAVTFQAESVAIKAKADYGIVLDSYQNTLVKDPTQYMDVRAATLSALNDPSGQFARMPANAREELQRQTEEKLAAAHVSGLIQNGAAELAKRKLVAGELDSVLDPKAKVALMTDADQAIRAREVEANRQKALDKEVKKAEEEAEQERMVQALAKGQLTTSMVLTSKLPPVGSGSKEHFLNVIRTRSKEVLERPIRTVPSVMANALEDIRSGRITDITQIERLYSERQQVAWSDVEQLRAELIDRRTPDGVRLSERKRDFFAGVKPMIDKSNPIKGTLDPSGSMQMLRYQAYVNQKIDEARQAGKSASEIHEMLIPGSKTFLGTPEQLSPYQRSIEDSTRAIMDSTRRPGVRQPAVEPRRPGESIADYQRRTGR